MIPTNPTPTPCDSQESRLPRVRVMCWGVVAVIATVMVACEWGQLYLIDRTVADSSLVNLAGRQRMLSQRIARAAIEQTLPASQRLKLTLDLDTLLTEFVAGHRNVTQGVAEYGATGPRALRAEQLLATLEPELDLVVGGARRLLVSDESLAPVARNVVRWDLLMAADRYLAKMDSLVHRLVEDSARRNSGIRTSIFVGCTAVLAMLVGLPLLFMDPAIQSARRAHAELLVNNKEIEAGRRRVEQAVDNLRDQVQLTESFFSTAADAIIVCNRRGRIEKANRAAARLFACESVVGRNLLDLVTEGCRDDLRSLLGQDGLSGPIGPPREMSAERSIDDTFAAEVSLARVGDGEGRRFIAIVRDISDRQQMQDQLAQAEKLESVGKLASGIAHEINTPLQYIASNLEYLGGRIPKLLDAVEQALAADAPHADPERAAATLAKARKQIPAALSDCDHGVEQVSGIIAAMKEFAHPGQPTLEQVDINRCVRNAVTISHSRCKQAASVRLDLDPNEPQAMCVASPLSQTLLNLLVNAADAITDAGRNAADGEIVVRSQAGEHGVTISVADNGCGMSDEVRRRVFDPFFTTKGVGRGSGQGLAIAYNAIVGKLGGSLDIESTPGEGTTFTIWIAAEPEQEASVRKLEEAV